MQDVPDFTALIDLWPSARAFGREVAGEKHQEQGRIWRRRNRVPKDLHPAVVAAAKGRGIEGVTLELLARLYAAGRGQGR